MATSKNNDMYSYLDQLSTQELEDLLQKDMEAADGGNLDMVMYIMEVIEKREGGISNADKKAAARALEEFFNSYATPEGNGLQLYPCDDLSNTVHTQDSHKEKQHKFSVRSIVLIAAVLICVFSLVACSTSGIERFFQMVGKWTSDIFMFESQDIENSGNDDKDAEIAISEEMQYATMEAALSAYGITEKVVPVIPDEFDIVAIDVIPLDGENTLFYASYRNFDKYLTLQITVHNVPEARSFEKDSLDILEYSHNGTTYYLYKTNNSNCAAWFWGCLECQIDTNITQENIICMIDSI